MHCNLRPIHLTWCQLSHLSKSAIATFASFRFRPPMGTSSLLRFFHSKSTHVIAICYSIWLRAQGYFRHSTLHQTFGRDIPSLDACSQTSNIRILHIKLRALIGDMIVKKYGQICLKWEKLNENNLKNYIKKIYDYVFYIEQQHKYRYSCTKI